MLSEHMSTILYVSILGLPAVLALASLYRYTRMSSTQDMKRTEASHNFVIIGGGFGGLAVAHKLLKGVIPSLSAKERYQVIIISPNTQFYWKVGAPRQIVNPTKLSQSKLFLDFSLGFKKYGSLQFKHVKAYAIAIDPVKKTIACGTTRDGPATSSVHYDSLILASGTMFEDLIWSAERGEDATKEALQEKHEQLSTAKTVVVVGGGASGVETSGELGYLFEHTKEIRLLSGTSKLLPRLKNPRIGEDAQRRLEKLGVMVIHNVRVVSTTKMEAGQTLVKLSDGSERLVDVYINATGDLPNNTFIPREWLDEKGYVKTHNKTLRLDVPGFDNVYVIGSVGSYSDGAIAAVMRGYAAVCESIQIDVAGRSDATRRTNFTPFKDDFHIVPIGPNQGVGTTFGWAWPSWAVALYKSRNYNLFLTGMFVNGTGL